MIVLKQLGKERVMDNRDFALAVVDSLTKRPSFWLMQSEEYCWSSTFGGIMDVIGEGWIVTEENLSRSTEVIIKVFPRPKLNPKIYGICLTLKDCESLTPKKYSWHFVVQRAASMEWLAISEGVAVDHNGNLVVDYDDAECTFMRHHPVWPWPAINPAPFQMVAWIDDMLQPDEANPLTGLLVSSRGETRTLAAQLKKRFFSERNLLYRQAERIALGKSSENDGGSEES